MKYDPEKHHRRSIRLKNYDYTRSGAYFATICTKDRACAFGAAENGNIRLNNVGKIAQAAWNDLPERFPSIGLDAFIVMPNHVHGIIFIIGAQFIEPNAIPPVLNSGVINHAPTLGRILRAFKATSTRLIRQAGGTDFAWQRNYYEHVIRSEESLNRIRQYIFDNPVRWTMDPENPSATTVEPEDAWRV